MKSLYEGFIRVVFQKSPYNICEAYDGERVSVQDFQTLVQAVYNGQCGTSTSKVTMSFSISKDDMQRIASLAGIANNGKLIFYNTNEPLGIGAVLVQGNAGFYPIKFDDQVELSLVGQPKGDLLIKQIVKGCDPFDDVCDASCVFKRICDPVCDDGTKHNIPCNLACIDTNSNGVIDEQDAQQRISEGKCNPDCYVNYTNPFKAYDPGCIWKYKNQNDDICDPNSNGAADGVCDPDCVSSKNICDPDCNGTTYDGNPYGLYDKKCFVCDGTCNGLCSPVCDKNALPGDSGYDPDCNRQNDPAFFCGGDGICDASRGENCANSADCPGGGVTCGDYNPSNACCPQANDADYAGCSPTKGLKEGDNCLCGTQCENNLVCDGTNHCCSEGKTWNGKSCEFKYTFTILFIQLNRQIPNFKQKAEEARNIWASISPLKNCKDKVGLIVVDDKICNVPNQDAICNGDNQGVADTMNGIVNCAKQWGYDGAYTRVEGVFPGNLVCDGIGGYTDAYQPMLVSAAGQMDFVSSHEMGHTFGLCDEGYGNSICPDCKGGICSYGGGVCCGTESKSTCESNHAISCMDGFSGRTASGTVTGYSCPNSPQQSSIMCTDDPCGRGCSTGEQFASTSYSHLQTELDKYCK